MMKGNFPVGRANNEPAIVGSTTTKKNKYKKCELSFGPAFGICIVTLNPINFIFECFYISLSGQLNFFLNIFLNLSLLNNCSTAEMIECSDGVISDLSTFFLTLPYSCVIQLLL